MDGEDARKRRLNNRTKARKRRYKKLVSACKKYKTKTKRRDCDFDFFLVLLFEDVVRELASLGISAL